MRRGKLRETCQVRILIVLTAGPASESAVTAQRLAAAAVAGGHEVSVFLAGDGVLNAPLLAGAGTVTLCDADLRKRSGTTFSEEQVRRGSLRDLATWCTNAEKVLVLT